jgi:hypothetical protein
MEKGWPTWVIGLGLLAVVLLILVGAFLLNDRLRPRVGLDLATTAATASPLKPQSTASVLTGSLAVDTASNGTSATGAPTFDTAGTRQAVLQAYLHYWDVYSDALITLDSSHLADVMAGDELSRARQLIDQLHSESHALKTDVAHHYEITSVSNDVATITDNFLNRSYDVDAVTKQPVGSPNPPTTESLLYRMETVDGVWKVVRAVKVSITVDQQ